MLVDLWKSPNLIPNDGLKKKQEAKGVLFPHIKKIKGKLSQYWEEQQLTIEFYN